jgi:two-component system response regulator DesR
MAEAMERRLAAEPRLEWVGWVSDSSEAPAHAQRKEPDVVMLDIDMPGQDSFEVLRDLVRVVPRTRVVMLSGHVRQDYIDRAIDGGAWGYLSKNESMDDLFAAILRIASGEFVLSPEVEAEYRGQA